MASRFAVPAFFAISGFFITQQEVFGQEPISKIIYSRIRRIMPPYVFWSLIYYSLFVITGEAYATHQSLAIIFIEKLITGTVTWQLFFIITILQYYLMCLWGIGKKGQIGRFAWVLFGGIQLVFIILNYFALFKNDFSPKLIYVLTFFQAYSRSTFPMFVSFFIFGRWLGGDYEKILKKYEKYRRLILTALALSFIASIVEFSILKEYTKGVMKLPQDWQLTANVYAFLFIIYMIMYLKSFQFHKIDFVLIRIANLSFILYLLHEPMLGYITKLFYTYTPLLTASQFLFQPILVITCIGTSIAIYKIIAVLFPVKARSLLFG
jgi:peptidoglycan/LPS O-acetylase OafA/YrhL